MKIKNNGYIMIYDIYNSSNELQGIVKQYLVIYSFDGLEKLLFLPNGCNFIIFNRGFEGYSKAYKDDTVFRIPKNYSISVKSNKVKQFILKDTTDSEALNFPIILAELMPIGFYKLFKKDAYLLNYNYMDLDKEIEDKYFKQLYSHKSIENEIAYLNNSLTALYTSQNHKSIYIEKVIDTIVNGYHFEITIESLLLEFECSRSTMERQFKKVIGFTPKNFIFIAKFCKTVLAYIENGCRFSELKYLYSDSSHLNAVFKKFLGVNPSLLLNEVINHKIMIYQMQEINENISLEFYDKQQ